MKKLFRLFLVVAAGLVLASCVKESLNPADPARGGEPVPVTFSVSLGDVLTKAAPEASGFDDASGEFKLYAAVFSRTTGALMASSKIGGTGFQPVGTISAKSASIVLTLSRSEDYKVVFFAMHDDAYDVNFADNNVATFSFKRSVKANDASLDAFYASVDVSASTNRYDVTLKRPFAQVNVLVPLTNVPAGQTAFSSSMTVSAPTGFNLFSGAAGTEVQEITFAANAISATPVGNYKSTHRWIGMNFVLVPASGSVTVTSFAESGMTEGIRIGTVPVKVNGRTNIVGSIYTLSDYFFSLQIGSDLDEEAETQLGGGESGQGGGESGGEGGGESGGGSTVTDTEIVIAGGTTYTAESPLTLSAAQSVSLLVNGDDFATVEAGAGGAKVTAVSSNSAVATAEVKDGAVLITPKSNGTATVTISTPAYTKTAYAAQTFEIPVKVEGMVTPPAPGASDTITFADLALVNGTQYKDPFTQGNMTVQFGAGNNDGKYYDTGSGMRIYGDGWVTVTSATRTIVKIEYTFDTTTNTNNGVVSSYLPDEATFGSVDTGSYDLATRTWTGSATSVTLTRAAGTGHWRLQKVKAYYSDSGEEGGGSGEQGGGGEGQGSGGEGQGGGESTAKGLPYAQDFKANGKGDFVIDDKTLPEGLTYVWNYDNRYGMKASGYYQQAYATESWLVSPVVNLSSAQHPVLTFRHAVNQFESIDKAKEEATVWVREENGTWTQLTGVTYPSSLSWDFVDSGEIDLSGYVGKNVQVAFKYVSTTTKAGTWEVDKFSIAEQAGSGGQGGSGETGGQGGGSGETGGTPDATLTNDEIRAATVDAEITSENPSYRDATITSASGTWTGNIAKHKDGVKYLQIRNKKGAFITSPLFTSAISKVAVTITDEDGVTLADRTLHAVPPTTTLPTGQDSNGKDITYSATEWQNEFGCVRTGAEGGATVVIEFAEGSNIKQFMLIAEGGAVYIDHLDVYY